MFHIRSIMSASLPDCLQTDLVIALRMIENGPRRDYASKLSMDRDNGSRKIAERIVEHLLRCGYRVEPPPPAPPSLNRG
jgi:hypothetical protein